MRIFSKKSGFKNARDLILFIFGLSVDVYHILTTSPANLSIPLLIFGAGVAGSPIFLSRDEKGDE